MLRDRKLKGRAEGTLDCYRVKAGHLARILGSKLTLHAVTARKVDAFIDQRLEEGGLRNTIHKELTVLRGTLKVAKRRGELPATLRPSCPTSSPPSTSRASGTRRPAKRRPSSPS